MFFQGKNTYISTLYISTSKYKYLPIIIFLFCEYFSLNVFSSTIYLSFDQEISMNTYFFLRRKESHVEFKFPISKWRAITFHIMGL